MPVVQQIKVPLIAVNDTSLTVVGIPFSHGAFVAKGTVVLVFETSKTTYDVLAEADGYIRYSCLLDNDYEVNASVAHIYSTIGEVPASMQAAPVTGLLNSQSGNFKVAAPDWKGASVFSNSALQLMKERNLSPGLFEGKDFVSRLEVEQLLGIATPEKIIAQIIPVKKATNLLPADLEKVTVKKISTAKRKEIEYLSSVQSTGLISTINTLVETDGLFTHINQSLQFLKDSLLPVIIYETARLLEKYTALNAYFTGDAIASYKTVNIGFAVDIDKGLKVLRINGAAQKTIASIEAAILELSGKYLDDGLQIDDLSDVTFTITDLSAERVAYFTPLVNMMNSAILGISAIDEKLNRCVLSVTFDHRVTEGKLVARFLAELKERIESYKSTYSTHKQKEVICFKCFKTLEEDLADVGFSKCVTPAGEDAYICQSCFKGF